MRRYIVGGIAALGVLSATPAVAPAAAPVASFTIGQPAYIVPSTPPNVVVSTPLYASGLTFPFTSTSVDPDGDPLTLAWDLDGDGEFDDWTTAQAVWSYGPGEYAVSLRATDPGGGTSTATSTVIVTQPPGGGGNPPPTGGTDPAPQPPPEAQPTPTVAPAARNASPLPQAVSTGAPAPARARASRTLRASARLTGRILTVRAPKGSRAVVRIQGRKLVRRMRSTRLRVRLGRLRRGTVVGILVTRPGYQDRHIRIRA